MKVLIMFHLDDEDVKEISAQDLHPQDLIDQINDAAINEDLRDEVWHFSDSSYVSVVTTLSKLWDEESETVPDHELIGRL